MDLLKYILIVCFSASILIVNPTEIAIVHQRFVGESARSLLFPNPLGRGVYFIAPFVDEPNIYSTKSQSVTIEQPNAIIVHTRDNHELSVELGVAYSINFDQIEFLDKKWGKHYAEAFIEPTVRSVVQKLFTLYTEEEFYRQFVERRQSFDDVVTLQLAQPFQENGFYISYTLLAHVQFTAAFTAQIESELLATATAQAHK